MATRLSPEVRYLRSITEAAWQSKLVEAAGFCRWQWWHDRDSRGNAKGLPDLILWKSHQFMGIELKTETGLLMPEQLDTLVSWSRAGVECHVWRPRQERQAMERLMGAGFRSDDCEVCALLQQ
jgi:hypothetical protein